MQNSFFSYACNEALYLGTVKYIILQDYREKIVCELQDLNLTFFDFAGKGAEFHGYYSENCLFNDAFAHF